ncbi:MAG: Stage III sporulation protein AF (Spore_III_AF) [Pelotomaculum sp. PtaB.Bin104]|nr:MAG: Stage III sporulation protein AF (Spore_III_AF) [Pelotomaculum sp. PtaB.Bin104]
MEILRGLIQNLIIIIILAMFLEMLLTDGGMRQYVKMVMGLLIIIAVIQAIGDLMHKDYTAELPSLTENAGQAQLSGIIDAGQKLSSEQQQQAITQYKQGLGHQVLALAGMHQAVPVVDAQVGVNARPGDTDFGQINEIIMVIEKDPSRSETQANGSLVVDVEPVAVQVSGSAQRQEPSMAAAGPPRETVAGLISTVANFYNLKPEQVKCVYR